MTIPTKVVVDCATGFISEVPLTDEEMAQREADAQAFAAAQAAKEAEEATLAAAKQSAQEKLKSLGLTDTEIAALTGI